MQRAQWTTKDEVIDSLALKTNRGDTAIVSLIESLAMMAEYASSFETALRARGEHELASALIDGGTL